MDFSLFLSQVFTPEGELVLKFGSNGEGNGQFNAPTGVAVDVNGNIIVADWGNSRIQVQMCCTVQLNVFLINSYFPLCLNNSRCLTAVAPSSPTSTHQQTLYMDPKVWL